MGRPFLLQIQQQSTEEAIQSVIQATLLIAMIGGALLLIVLMLRLTAQMDALPKRSKSNGKASADGAANEPMIQLQAAANSFVTVQWSVPADQASALSADHTQLMLRLLDATCIDLSTQSPHAVFDYPCDWVTDGSVQTMTIALTARDRDYIAEVGYHSDAGEWQLLARSNHVRVD